MKKLLLSIVSASMLFSCAQQATINTSITSDKDTASYAIGMMLASQFPIPDTLNVDAVINGFADMVKDTSFLTQEEATAFLDAFFMPEEYKEMKAANIAYLEKNKTEAGVVTTGSGLQYSILKDGEGHSPAPTDVVEVHYHGTLIDGTVFDSSVDRGEPATFQVGGVIPGWVEGLQLMKEGAKYKFVIPQELAYGANPRQGGPIPPYATLIFEVELISIQGHDHKN